MEKAGESGLSLWRKRGKADFHRGACEGKWTFTGESEGKESLCLGFHLEGKTGAESLNQGLSESNVKVVKGIWEGAD